MKSKLSYAHLDNINSFYHNFLENLDKIMILTFYCNNFEYFSHQNLV